MSFEDRTLSCLDCKNEFVFTAGEQEFYERKGFREIPKRCRPCRDARKQRRDGGGGHAARNGDSYGNGNGYGGNGHGHNGNGYGHDDGRRPARELFDAVCASCGAPARVPFRPANGRPVYCRECYSTRQAQGSGYGG
jgi:CxxC-x17-CxxC domain-containing protein